MSDHLQHLSERYKLGDRIQITERPTNSGDNKTALTKREVAIANAAHQAGREEASAEGGRFLEAAATTGSSMSITAAQREMVRIGSGHPTYPANPPGGDRPMSDRIEKSEPVKEPPFGTAGGLYYPSDGAHGLAKFLGLDGIGRAALHAELRECYVLAKREAEEAAADLKDLIRELEG